MINILFSCIVREYVEQEYINRKVKTVKIRSVVNVKIM